jgi:16S rRNA processing protein RimM
MEELVTIGRLMRPHGVRGQIKCMPETHDLSRHSKLRRVYASQNGKMTELLIEKSALMDSIWLLKFEGYDTPESVAPYVNAELSIPISERLPAPEGEFYFSDLVDFDVIDSAGKTFAKVLSVESLPTVNAFRIRYHGKEIFAPWIDDCVGEIDTIKRTVQISEAYLAHMFGVDP